MAGTYLTTEEVLVVVRASVVARIMVVTRMHKVSLKVLQVTQDKLVSVKKLVLHKLPDEMVGAEAPEVAEVPEEEVVDLAEAVV